MQEAFLSNRPPVLVRGSRGVGSPEYSDLNVPAQWAMIENPDPRKIGPEHSGGSLTDSFVLIFIEHIYRPRNTVLLFPPMNFPSHYQCHPPTRLEKGRDH